MSSESICSETIFFEPYDEDSNMNNTLKSLEKEKEKCKLLEKHIKEMKVESKTMELQVKELENALQLCEEEKTKYKKAEAQQTVTKENNKNDKKTQTDKKQVTTKRQQTDVLQLAQRSTQTEEQVPLESSPTHSKLTAMNERLEVEITYERNRNDFLEERRIKLQGELTKLKRESNTLHEQILRLQSENDDLQNQIGLASSKIEKPLKISSAPEKDRRKN